MRQEHWERVWTLGFGFPAFTLFYCMYSWQWHWFARAGALRTVMGILLTGAQLIENGRRFKNVIRFMDGEGKVKPAYTHLDDRLLGEYLGFRLLIVGTLIWAFGDLPSVTWPSGIK
jgi:hypothetical protein